jgi:hypothetical protein
LFFVGLWGQFAEKATGIVHSDLSQLFNGFQPNFEGKVSSNEKLELPIYF